MKRVFLPKFYKIKEVYILHYMTSIRTTVYEKINENQEVLNADVGLLGCDTVLASRQIPTFRLHLQDEALVSTYKATGVHNPEEQTSTSSMSWEPQI
jgi:hypothetical protein